MHLLLLVKPSSVACITPAINARYMASIHTSLSISTPFQPGIPQIIDPLRQNFPLEVEWPSASPDTLQTLETGFSGEKAGVFLKYFVIYLKIPNRAARAGLLSQPWPQRRGDRVGTGFLAVLS